MFASPFVFAEEYRVLVIPDNIVTDSETVDAYIYNATSEFFASEVINILNQTDYIKSPTVSELRKQLKNNPAYMIPAKNLTSKFKTTYNIDYVQLKKIAAVSRSGYVLLLTSSIDSENYILRRTVWDFLNIPGATVIDPAYKICTYAALIDIKNNIVLWSNTFYKTISVVEGRIITRGPSPQTEQLQKIRDYSRMLCPEIAQNVQQRVLPSNVYSNESNQIYYDMGNFDNEFTKKYRRWYKEGSKDINVAKTKVDAQIVSTKKKLKKTKDNIKTKYNQCQQERTERQQNKQIRQQLEVKAEPVENKIEYSVPNIKQSEFNIKNLNFFKKTVLEDDSLYSPINIKKTRKNNLYGDYDATRPPLREYN